MSAVGSEEFDVAPCGLVAAGIGNECRHYIDVGRGGEVAGLDDRRELVGGRHGPSSTTDLTNDRAGADAESNDPVMKAVANKPYPAAAARGSAVVDFAGVSRTQTAATIAASAANPASA